MPIHDGFNLRRPIGYLLKVVGLYDVVCLVFAVSHKSMEKVMSTCVVIHCLCFNVFL